MAKALWLGLASLALTAAIGLAFLIRQRHWSGNWHRSVSAGLLLVVAYTPWLTRWPWLCLAGSGPGLRPADALGTQVVLAGEVGMKRACCCCGAVLPVQQPAAAQRYPHIDADRSIGRLTLPMLLGRPRALTGAGAQWLLAFAGLLGFVLAGWAPTGAALGLLGVLLVLCGAWRLLRRDTEAAECLLLGRMG